MLIAAAVWAAPPQPAIVNAVSDIYRPFPPDQQKLGGLIAARMRANSEGFIEKIATEVANGSGKDETGTLLDAAVYAFEYSRDSQVNAVMVRFARKLMAAQGPDGYIGTRASADEWTVADTFSQNADLLGLMNYYRVTGDQAAISAAIKSGNLLVQERQKNSKKAAVFAGALEGTLQLYRYTDDNKYLTFCTAVAEAWLHEKPPELAATFENLSVLDGLVDLYRISGDNTFFAAPLQSWTEMHASAFTLTGVPADGAQPDSKAFSACTTSAWLRLTANLLRISGQAIYAEQLERTVYNQLFAGQDVRNGAVLAPVTWGGKKEPANSSACAANEVVGLALLPSLVWGRYGNGIAVNLYTGGRATVRLRRRGTTQIYSEANYPESGSISLHVEPDHPTHFPLRLRVPEWTSKFTADIAGDHLVGKPGQFLTINRGWKRGDTVRISIEMDARVIPGVHEYSKDVAIARGPQILALGKAFNPEIGDLNAVALESSASGQVVLSPIANSYTAIWMGDQAYSVNGVYNGQPRKLVLVPFAEARDYRVWLAQSKASSGASEP